MRKIDYKKRIFDGAFKGMILFRQEEIERLKVRSDSNSFWRQGSIENCLNLWYIYSISNRILWRMDS